MVLISAHRVRRLIEKNTEKFHPLGFSSNVMQNTKMLSLAW